MPWNSEGPSSSFCLCGVGNGPVSILLSWQQFPGIQCFLIEMLRSTWKIQLRKTLSTDVLLLEGVRLLTNLSPKNNPLWVFVQRRLFVPARVKFPAPCLLTRKHERVWSCFPLLLEKSLLLTASAFPQLCSTAALTAVWSGRLHSDCMRHQSSS